jgi:hypothetical protein
MTEQISSLNKTTTMTTSDPTSSQLLQEARSVDTCAERLQELNRVDPALGPQIASNPSAPIELLDQLALQCPTEVLANPVLQFRDLETGGGAYEKFSLRSLVCLCLVCDPKRDAHLLAETRRRICAGLDELRRQEEASLTSIWQHQRTFTLRPKDCGNLIDCNIDFKVRSEAFVEGRGAISIYGIPEVDAPVSGSDASQRTMMAQFLGALASNRFQDFIDDSQITLDHSGDVDFILSAIDLPRGYEFDGSQLSKDEVPLFEFSYECSGDGIIFENKYLIVGIGGIEEADQKIEVPMGELNELLGFEPTPSGKRPADWTRRLAKLLFS